MVDRRTALLNQLSSLLKSYYPQACRCSKSNTSMAVAFLKTLARADRLKAAKTATLKSFSTANVRSAEFGERRLELIAQAVALTSDEARVSVPCCNCTNWWTS